MQEVGAESDEETEEEEQESEGAEEGESEAAQAENPEIQEAREAHVHATQVRHHQETSQDEETRWSRKLHVVQTTTD